jgi:hypothetical protein
MLHSFVKIIAGTMYRTTESLDFNRVMPPLQQESRALHVVTDNKQRTTLKARRNLWHFQTQRRTETRARKT